ncbi:zinc ABC transporter substrate-binding protein [bacterium]|nr:zinc ABC transporter substrate-binding protein [bacterium]
MKWIFWAVIILWSHLISAETPVLVSGVIAPVSSVVKQIGGESVNVITLVPPGSSPHVYEPSPMAVRGLRRASVAVTIGNLGLTVAQPDHLKALAPSIRVVDITDGETLLDDDDHGHGHDHNGDPHVWMSPVIMSHQVGEIADALAKINPKQAVVYRRRAAQLSQQFARLVDRYRARFSRQNVVVIVVHPSLTYLARDIGFTQMAIETHGKPPSVFQLRQIIATAKKSRRCVIVLQTQYGRDLIEVVARQTGTPVIEADIYRADYPANIERLLDQILEATASRR